MVSRKSELFCDPDGYWGFPKADQDLLFQVFDKARALTLVAVSAKGIWTDMNKLLSKKRKE